MGSGTQGPASLVGHITNGYRLERVLGKGSTGIVFLGRRVDETPQLIERTQALPVELPLEAAIKVLVLPWQLDDAERIEFRKRFAREAATLRQLSHPHILPVITYGEDEATGSSYMILPYLSGGTLQDKLAKRIQPMPLDEVKRLLDQIASAVDYAHSRGIVHRDIKPGNILLDEQGQAVLSDFSIARLIVEATTRLTRTGLALGTPTYMPPEALAGQAVSPAADIYSLGMVVYKMVVGLREDTSNPPPPPRTFRADLPEPAEATILQALENAPKKRFPTATVFAQAFAQGLLGQWPSGLTRFVVPIDRSATGEETAQTLPDGLSARQDNGSRRRRLGILSAAVALLLMVACVAATVLALPESRLLVLLVPHPLSTNSSGAGSGTRATPALAQTASPANHTTTPGARATATQKGGSGGSGNNGGGGILATSTAMIDPTATPISAPTLTPTPTLPDLVISTSASQSTDGQSHGSGNPYYFTGNHAYGNVTIQAGACATAVDYCTGGGSGIVQFSATGTVNIEGTLTVDGEGYCGGPIVYGTALGIQGDSYTGHGITSPAANGGGGGGSDTPDDGAAGGGYGTVGQPGVNSLSVGGQTYGEPTLTTVFLGSGGGGSGAGSANSGAAGGAGGGAISIRANTIIITGSVSANGNDGGSHVAASGLNYYGAGGGSGGSIFLYGNAVALGVDLVTATGGTGGYGVTNGVAASGGSGGVGRIRVEYTQSVTGVTSPAASIARA